MQMDGAFIELLIAVASTLTMDPTIRANWKRKMDMHFSETKFAVNLSIITTKNVCLCFLSFK